MNHKLCRICWNSRGWRRPSGEAVDLESNSYVAANGFGHEEWLFNYEWMIGGYKYGFLQPINKYLSTYQGKTLDILLYTISPSGDRLLVGCIRNAYVPHEDELKKIVRQMKKNGWIDQMQEDCALIDWPVSEEKLGYPHAGAIINIRFRPRDVTLFDPMPLVREKSFIGSARYQPLNWDGVLPGWLASGAAVDEPDAVDPLRSEEARNRSAQQGTTYDPRHVRLQNALYRKLCEKYGKRNVDYEKDYVDLALTTSRGKVFFEIKVESTAKKCIRSALGQLLEYAHYPAAAKAGQFVVVGDAPLTEEDSLYLGQLSELYRLPLSYAQFSWETSSLEGWVS